jgi:hypothetical protein
VAELESTKHCPDRATCTPILTSGRHPYSKKGGRILEMAVTVAAEATRPPAGAAATAIAPSSGTALGGGTTLRPLLQMTYQGPNP